MGEVSEILKVFVGRTNGFDSIEDQLKDFVLESHETNVDKVQEVLNSMRNTLTKRNDALEAMVIALKEETIATARALSTRIEELEGKLALC
ncbi:hypothetical protein J1N35_044757 [Gossypium stocksii]|uniref:Uncharacterized protein n=1 Tax=Gossypium stocksii TaxID=47602 RepID=A0A9D3UA38_9ROSI|nr:hypothetical protein J1N35_044757 [Gossypium stocksii]